MPSKGVPAVFFDRDGTLNVDIHYLHRPEDFIWTPDAPAAIRRLNECGILTVVVTNQSGVARGYYPEEDVLRLHDWMNEELKKEGAHLDAIFYCPHHIDGKIPEYTKACNCRKPATGMIDAACAEYDIDRTRAVLIGDSESDMECARRAGVRGVRYEGGSLLEVVERVLGWLE
ncbi:HAD family hydrolase [uncultured Selenomonas sp.]|uniref:D-glycero-alpha-D-manno-heptose-1,7-bisphosphate 7-phosphatase n=1 Tax=uncultured Selenomonas sp. TaxID=159275 RepID=UPI0028EB049A|nr:HAD family hydrolase [uncultured Selenomonas sp.]